MTTKTFFSVTLVIVMLALLGVGEGFLLSNNQCVAPSPCTCSSNYVQCNSKSLVSVPTFIPTASKDKTGTLYIYLYNNHISAIHDKAFKNISSINTTNLDLRLYGNNISLINSYAFAGIENITNRIDLENNKLTTLSAAFGKLNNLKELLLQGNPIISLDSSVMSHLGRSLTSLSISMGGFQSWPTSVNFLSHLTTLTAYTIPFNHLPYNAFDGISSTLTSLNIQLSKLYRIPPAVCHLHNLQTLNFDSNSNLETNASIFEPCDHKLIHLTSLSLAYDGLTAFPNVLFYFPSLTSLSLYNNHITFVPSSAIPYHSSLTTLNMAYNALTRIPFAIHKLKQLQTLYLYNNKISSVEDNDISGLTSLNNLRIYSNPIQYVAPNAFKTNVKLSILDLDNTKLTSIPEAVLSLPSLRNLYFNGNDVQCSCGMSYLKSWNVTWISVRGNCNNQANDRLEQYILTSLPHCP